MAYASNDIYAFYKTTTKTPVEKAVFKDIVTTFNMKMMDHVLDGGYIFLGNGCSYVRIIRERNRYDGDLIDWNASRKLSEERGEKLLVYFTSPWVFKFNWAKKHVYIRNAKYYKFRATRGDKGVKTRFKDILKNRPEMVAKYIMQDGNIPNRKFSNDNSKTVPQP